MYFVPLEPFLVAVALYWIASLAIEGAVALVQRVARRRGLAHA
jgi:polar amino acid transport system permease protein